jgi:class 3 adenylate cyclase
VTPEEPHGTDGPAPALTRGFLFADLRGYTAYVDEHGDHAAAELLARYRALVRAIVANAHGAEIKTEGDSFYVVFDSASAAVRAGLGIIAAADAAPGEPIRVGIGIHAGETVETAEGFVGSAVNIAARLCGQAKAGELVVSDTVRALTRTYLDVDFVPQGARRLKGVNEPIAVYRVTPRGTGTARPHLRPAAGRRRLWLAGLGLVAVVAIIATAWMVNLRGSGVAAASPSASPTSPSGSLVATALPSSSGPSGSPEAGALTADEQALLARIPGDFRPFCRRSNPTDGSLGGDVSLRCDLSSMLDTSAIFGADSAWFDQFGSPGAMVAAVNGLVGRQKIPIGDCSAGGTAVTRWSMGITFTGQLACYTRDDGAWIAWSYEGQDILVRADRHDGSAARIFSWWNEVRGYLGPGG